MERARTVLLSLAIGMLPVVACDDTPTSNADTNPGPGGETRLDLALCSPDNPGFSLVSTNPFFPMPVGSRWVLEGEEDDEALRVEITVLDETEAVAGVETRVIEEREFADEELVEVSLNFIAQAADGTICYFGEDVDDFEDGEIVSHEGAWRADDPGNQPGILMPADPRVGTAFQMEGAPGVAIDEGLILAEDETVEVPAGRFVETIRVRESNPLEGDAGEKVYAAGVGILVDEAIELVEF